MNPEEFVSLIKKSKKYKDISEEVIRNKVNEFFEKYDVSDEEFVLKEIKASLHKAHGSFRFFDKKLEKDLEKKDFRSILNKNRSTKERFDFYEDLYKEIFEITGKPKSIVDLGAGLNPVSIPIMQLDKNLVYYSYDINDKESNFLNDFFKKFNINGKSQVLDLTKIENVKKVPSCDLILAFKLIDVLEEDMKGHKYSEEMIKIILEKAKFIVISFSKLTISGKFMNFPNRGWIERMFERNNFKFEKLDFDSEIFYVISK